MQMRSQNYIQCLVLEWTYTQYLRGDRSLNLWAYEKEGIFFGGQKIAINLFSNLSVESADNRGEMHLVRDLNEYGIEDCVECSITADQSYIFYFFEALLRLPKSKSSYAFITLVTPAIVNTGQLTITDFSFHISNIDNRAPPLRQN